VSKDTTLISNEIVSIYWSFYKFYNPTNQNWCSSN